MKLETLCLHAGYTSDPTTHACAVPVYRTASYVFNSTEHAANLFALRELGNIYTRLMNPTHDVLEQRVAALEGGAAGLAIASGTSAIFYSIINLAQAGDNIVSARNLYGGTYTQFKDILPALGIEVRFVDSNDPENFAAAIDDKTRALFCESVSNPALEISDLEAIANIAHAHGLPLIVDSTFSTPYLTKPIEFGADIVVHSLTKWLGGHGTGIGGIVIDSGKFNWAGGKHPLFDAAGRLLSRPALGPRPARTARAARLYPAHAHRSAAQPRRLHLARQRLASPCKASKPCRCAWSAIAKTRSPWPSTCKPIPAVEWVRFPGLPGDPPGRAQRQIPPRQGRLDGRLRHQGRRGRRREVHRLASSSSSTSPTSAMPSRSPSTRPPPPTPSSTQEQQLAAGITPELIRLSIGIEHIDDILADLDQALAIAVQS